MSIIQEDRWPRRKRTRCLQCKTGTGGCRTKWREYGTHNADTTAGKTLPEQDLLLPSTSNNASAESTPHKSQSHSREAVSSPLNHLPKNDWSSRGRGKSWFSAWLAAGENEANNLLDEQYLNKHPPTQDNGSEGSFAQVERNRDLLASASFQRDLASLDAGLIHNPAKGTLHISKEIDPEVFPQQIQGPTETSNWFSVAGQEPEYANGVQESLGTPGLVASRPKIGPGAFRRSLQKVQDLFFPPWRPYTHINLDLDPEGEYIDPDMGSSEINQPEVPLDEQEQTSQIPEAKLEDPTIHILGLGAVGKFIAHTLASLPQAPPITLLMHRPLVMQHWHDEGAAIRLIKDGELHVQSDFNIESAAAFRREYPDQFFPRFGKNLEHSAEPPNTVIETLIVTTDSWVTLPALEAIKHRIRQRTTVFFLQNGLGMAEKVSEQIFIDPDRRPTYVLGSISHHITPTDRHFTISQSRSGTLICSKQPRREVYKTEVVSIKRDDFSWSPQAKHLVSSLTRAFDFNTQTLGHKSFYKTQLQQVVLGCIIGPLSVMYDCSNDKLLYNYNASLTMKALLEEISYVICSLPELQSLNGIDRAFDPSKLEGICVSAIVKTGATESAMLRSVRAGRRTNIAYYNGYILRRAYELGISCPTNEFILRMVEGKRQMRDKEITGYIPLIAAQ